MRRIFFILSLLITLNSCNDFFVKNISDSVVILTSPANNTVTTQLTQTFRWEEVNRSDYYRLQIVYPSFNATQYLVADTILYNEQFLTTLTPGTYQWRVKAYNSASETDFSEIRNLQIDTTSDLTNQTVALISPVNATYLNTNLPSFVWQHISIAQSYNIIVKSGTNWTTGSVILNDTVTNAYYNTSAGQEFNEASYIWGIRAINSLSYTNNYSTRLIHFDFTAPPSVTLISPLHNSIQNTGSITFNWQQSPDLGLLQSPRRDSFFVYADTSMSNLIHIDAVTNSTITKTISNSGIYRWVIRTYDAAGNFSGLSQKFDFTVQ